MKHKEDDDIFLSADLGQVTVFVRDIKHGSWNAEMPPGTSLLQESKNGSALLSLLFSGS